MSRQNISNKPIPGNKTVLQKLDTKRRGRIGVIYLILLAVIALVAVINFQKYLRRAELAKATNILEDLRELDAAIDQYLIESSLNGGESITFKDVLKNVKNGTTLRSSGGKDILGNRFIITKLGEAPKINDASYKALSDAVPADFWSPYH